MKLSSDQLKIVVRAVVAQADLTPDIELDLLLERFQEMCIKRHMRDELKLVQDVLKLRKMPIEKKFVPLLLRDPAA